MLKSLQLSAVVVLAALGPAAVASAQYGFGIHIGGGHYGHHDDHHYDHHDYYGHPHHADWHHVVPHYDHHYDGSYYSHDGVNYYIPQPHVEGGHHVAAQPVVIRFAGYSHVDDLAGRLERLANELCLDLHYNYRHNRGFAATYREAYQILGTAQYIHDKEHQGDRDEVARRLEELDGLFHHVQDDIQGWSRRNVRQIGQSGVRAKLNQIAATLHHLMNDVGVRGSHDRRLPAPTPAEFEIAPTPAE